MRARPRPKRYLRKLAARQPCVHGKPGVELQPYQIILRPLVTEKGTHQSTRYNTYAFMVNPLATKTQIQHAVEEVKGRGIPEWLLIETTGLSGKVSQLPTRAQINLPVQEQLIVELYSK